MLKDVYHSGDRFRLVYREWMDGTELCTAK